MQISTDDQGLLLVVFLGFAAFVVLLHLGELAVLSLQLHAWKLTLGSGSLLLLATLFLVWQVVLHAESGFRFSDMLALIGAQLGIVVCLPSRVLLRRKCQWERMRAQEEWEWERTASHPYYVEPQPIRPPRHPNERRAGAGRHGR